MCRLDTPSGLLAMVVFAFLLQILIASHAGFYADPKWFQTRATSLDEVGLHRFYTHGASGDYPPGYMYVLWLLGKISAPPGYVLLKTPAILADVAIAWIAGIFAERIAPPSLKDRVPVRLVVTAAALFSPAFIMLGAVWGQADAVPALFAPLCRP
jgi:Gpi18-like mannosyltransferase